MRSFRTYVLVIAFIIQYPLCAQELYPYAEPASTLPKRMLGLKQMNEVFHDDNSRSRFYSAFRIMYGLHQYCTVGVTTGISNHHLKTIPKNFLFYLLNHHSRRFPDNPVVLEGIHTYAKIRCFSYDGSQRHWRLAALLEASWSQAAHDEAEPNLMTDNTGYGIHVIGTRLYKRWAINLQAGMIQPKPFRQEATETGSEFYIRYSEAVLVTLSNGFRIYPYIIRDYRQTNVNLYVELHYKKYDAAQVEVNGRKLDYADYKEYDILLYESMAANTYVDARMYIQFIVDSQNRLELGITLPAYSRSYLHSYPMFSVQVQRFLFGRK